MGVQQRSRCAPGALEVPFVLNCTICVVSKLSVQSNLILFLNMPPLILSKSSDPQGEAPQSPESPLFPFNPRGEIHLYYSGRSNLLAFTLSITVSNCREKGKEGLE